MTRNARATLKSMPPSGREKAASTTMRGRRNKWCQTVTTTNGKTISLQDVNRRNRFGETLLHRAVMREDIQLLKDILKLGPDVNTTDNAGWTALHEAVLSDQYEACLCLINAGAQVNVEATNGVTPLNDAITNGNKRIFELLMQHGANPECSPSAGNGGREEEEISGAQDIVNNRRSEPPLPECRSHHTPKKNMRSGPPMAPQRIRPRQPRSDDLSGSKVYYKNRVVSVKSIHRKDCFGETLLHKAAKEGNTHSVRQFLELGADVNAADNAGWTPLHEAALHGHYDVTLELLKAGALVNAVSCNGVRPLEDAIAKGHKKIVDVLCQNGAIQIQQMNSDEPVPQEELGGNRISNPGRNVPADGLQQTPADLEMHHDIQHNGLRESNSNGGTQSESETVKGLNCPQPQVSPIIVPQDSATLLETNVPTSSHHLLPLQETSQPSNPIYVPESRSSSTSSAILPEDGPEEDSDSESDQTLDYIGYSSDDTVHWAMTDTQDFGCAS